MLEVRRRQVERRQRVMRGRAVPVALPPSGTSVASQVCPSRALAPTFRRVRRRGHALSRAGTSTHYRKCAAEACHRATGGRLWPVGWRMWCYIPATRLRFSVLAVAVASTPNARPDDRQVRTTSHSGEPTREPEHRQNDASPLLAGGSRQSMPPEQKSCRCLPSPRQSTSPPCRRPATRMAAAWRRR